MVNENDIRKAALELPGTAEKSSYGSPGFRVKNKLFARIREEGDVLALWCSTITEKEALIVSDPQKFFTTSHYDGYSIVLVRMSSIDVDELAELLTEAWRVKAPKRMLQAFDAEESV